MVQVKLLRLQRYQGYQRVLFLFLRPWDILQGESRAKGLPSPQDNAIACGDNGQTSEANATENKEIFDEMEAQWITTTAAQWSL